MNIPNMSNYLHTYEAYGLHADGVGYKPTDEKLASSGTITSKANQKNEQNGVELVLTDEAKKLMQEEQSKYNEALVYMQNMENAKDNADAAAEGAREFSKIMTVFRRMSQGDIVPYTDERKLLEYDGKLYQAAKNAQMLAQNEERKEHKSLWEGEEEKEVECLTDPITCEDYSIMDD